MALPVIISGSSFAAAHNYGGPFKSSGGAFYTILIDSTDISLVEAHKATDPTDSFVEQDSGNKPDLTNNILAIWTYQDGDDLHIVHQETSAERAGYSTFNMTTDLWTIVDELIETITDLPGNVGCSIALRSNGDVIVLYTGNTDTVHGSARGRVDHARRELGIWTIGIAIDNGGADSWTHGPVIPGSSDRMHFFFSNIDEDDAYQRTLLSDNSLETFPAAGDTTAGNVGQAFAPGISYVSGGIQRIRCPYVDVGNLLSFAEFDSVDAPGAFTINADVSAHPPRRFSGPMACLSVDVEDEHLLYFRSADDSFYHKKNDETDVVILTLVDFNLNGMFCNIYDRDGTKLAYVYDDQGTTKYNELDIAVTSSFSGSDFPVQNYYVGPFSGSL